MSEGKTQAGNGIVALYLGRTVADCTLLAASSDPELIRLVAHWVRSNTILKIEDANRSLNCDCEVGLPVSTPLTLANIRLAVFDGNDRT